MKNILLIVVDGWRAECLGSLGHPCLKTPHLDRLSAEGVTFVRHFAQAVPCAPARASLLSGRYLMTHRVVQAGTPWPHDLGGLPDELRLAGYDPAFIGYASHVPDPRTTEPGDARFAKQGHAVMDGFRIVRTKDPDFLPYLDFLQANGYRRPAEPFDIWHPDNAAPGPFSAQPSPIDKTHSDTAWFVDAALDHLGQRTGGPWFLHLGTWRPHPPYIAPRPYNTAYPSDAMPPPHRQTSVNAERRQHPMHA